MTKKKISIVSSCFNEESNIPLLAMRLSAIFASLPQYEFEVILLDNGSNDGTVGEARKICLSDPRFKLIVNARNFGHVRSPVHGMFQADGAAVILMASDLEDPPELIIDFLSKWEAGSEIVAGTYCSTEGGSWFLKTCRKAFYWALGLFADAQPIPAFTGFGLYSRRAVEIIRGMNDPYPYLRGMVSEIGLPVSLVPFSKPARVHGVSSNNFLTLVDMAISGFVTMSRAPIRMATVIGALLSMSSLFLAIAFLAAKIIFWDSFSLGMAPLLIGVFFFSSVQLMFLGVIGEYVAAIHLKGQARPLVVERERVNFDENAPKP